MTSKKLTAISAVLFGLCFCQIAFSGGTSGNSIPIGGGTSGNSPVDNETKYRVIPFDSFILTESLPPMLMATFNVRCYQTFLKVVRHDVVDQATGKVTVVAAGLVSENLMNPCSSSEDMVEDAGVTYSGREFVVQSIQR